MGPQPEDWMAEAGEDLATARDNAENGHFSWAVFCAQQSVEKALKGAYLQLREDTPPMIHRLRPLAQMVFGEAADEVSAELAALERHYTTTRYPVSVVPRPSEHYTQDDAEEAVTLCCELLMWVQRRLTENDS